MSTPDPFDIASGGGPRGGGRGDQGTPETALQAQFSVFGEPGQVGGPPDTGGTAAEIIGALTDVAAAVGPDIAGSLDIPAGSVTVSDPTAVGGDVVAAADAAAAAGPVAADTGSLLDIGAITAADVSQSFLPATSIADVSTLSPEVAQTLGIDIGAANTASNVLAGPASTDVSAQLDTSALGTEDLNQYDPYNPDLSEVVAPNEPVPVPPAPGKSWWTDPKNLATMGLLGVSAYSALNKPSFNIKNLPPTAQTAANAANTLVPGAAATIASGGTGTPAWAQQKSAIDASIDQQIQNDTASMEQAMVNSGVGNQNSGLVQEQIASIKSRLETKRQELYMQAQEQNVMNAVATLTAENPVLGNIASLQLQGQQETNLLAMEIAQMALQLQGLG